MEKLEAPPKWGEYNLWDLYDLYEARPLKVGSVETFLHFLFSDGADHVGVVATDHGLGGRATFRVYGPITDDAIEEGMKLTEAEAEAAAAGGTRTAKHTGDRYEVKRLTAEFQLFADTLPFFLPTEEERDALVARLVELECNPSRLTLACTALKLNRGKRVK